MPEHTCQRLVLSQSDAAVGGWLFRRRCAHEAAASSLVSWNRRAVLPCLALVALGNSEAMAFASDDRSDRRIVHPQYRYGSQSSVGHILSPVHPRIGTAGRCVADANSKTIAGSK